MKKYLFILYILFPICTFADIIVTKSFENIEDVVIVSMSAQEVIYTDGSKQLSIPSDNVDGVLYNDGRYIAPPEASQTPIMTDSNDSRDDSSNQTETMVVQNRGRTHKEKTAKNNSEMKQATKEVFSALRQFYVTLFQSMKKKKTASDNNMEESTPSSQNSSDDSMELFTPSTDSKPTPSEDNW